MTPRAFLRPLAALALAFAAATLASAQNVVITMGTMAPTDSPWHRVLKQMGEDWKKESGGKVTLRILAGGTLGDERAMVQKMRVGVIQGMAISGVGLPEIDPGVMCLQIPLLVESYEELDDLRDKLAPTLEKRIEERGFVVLNWGDAGWIHFFTKQPARTLDDLRKLKLYTTAGDSGMENLMKSVGFRPVPLAGTDILPSLQTGIIDAFDVPPLFALSEQSFALANNMIDIPYAPLVGATVVAKKAWDKIPADLKPKLLAAAEAAGAKFRSEIRKLSDDAIVEMKKRGLQVVVTTPAEREAWRKESEAMWPKLRGPIVPPDLYDLAIKLRNDRRAQTHDPVAAPK